MSEHNSDADLAERHAAAVASTSARPMGLLERQDSANYQPRPPAMTERQDSAQNLQVRYRPGRHTACLSRAANFQAARRTGWHIWC